MPSMKGTLDVLASSSVALAKDITKDSQIPASALAACSHSGERIKDGAAAVVQGASNYASANPVTAGAILLGLGVAAAPGVVAAPILGAAGFTANGVAGGSVAAVVQSGIGNVVGGSAFATLQSAAAGGYGVAAVHTAVQAVGVGVSSTGAAILGRSKL